MTIQRLLRITIGRALGREWNGVINDYVAPGKAPMAGDKTTYGLPDFIGNPKTRQEAIQLLTARYDHEDLLDILEKFPSPPMGSENQTKQTRKQNASTT